MERQLRLGIIGDYDPNLPSHTATNEALSHAARALSVALDCTWLPTEPLEAKAGWASLGRFDALCCPGGTCRSMAGALQAIRFAREEGRPFVAT